VSDPTSVRPTAGEPAADLMARPLQRSRRELQLLVQEQTALLRVATLVARAVPVPELLDATVAEVHAALGADVTQLLRYEDDGTATAMATRPDAGAPIANGERAALEATDAAGTVLRTPFSVGDRRWGVIVAAWRREHAVTADTEHRVAQFTEFLASAIANAEGRAELAASRARAVAAADATRARIERDLHDGAQRRLVNLVIVLKLAQQAVTDRTPKVAGLVGEALAQAEHASAELRELAHGILPASLRHGGLRAAIEQLISCPGVPVTADVTALRLPPAVEETAYFVVAEALTNAAKHANARAVAVTVVLDDGGLRVEVRDDGIGGARVIDGRGLVGLKDRAAALGGRLLVHSPPGRGTTVTATLPTA
jgi:signal transduction histidine kinase